MRSTKIVATIGPASKDVDVLEKMIRAGMDIARLNFAHGTPDEQAGTARVVREAAERVGKRVAILGDIPGPKLRLGPIAGGVVEVRVGAQLTLTNRRVEGTERELPVVWQGLPELVTENDVIYLSDGAIRLRVASAAGEDVFLRSRSVAAWPRARASTCPTSRCRCPL